MANWMRRRWTVLTINWFTVALHCRLRGHQWRTARVETLELTDCAWCGRFKGYRRLSPRRRTGQATRAESHGMVLYRAGE